MVSRLEVFSEVAHDVRGVEVFRRAAVLAHLLRVSAVEAHNSRWGGLLFCFPRGSISGVMGVAHLRGAEGRYVYVKESKCFGGVSV
jgi:hypothetical protein